MQKSVLVVDDEKDIIEILIEDAFSPRDLSFNAIGSYCLEF